MQREGPAVGRTALLYIQEERNNLSSAETTAVLSLVIAQHQFAVLQQ